MGLFLADCVSARSAVWLLGVAIAASAVSLATLPDPDPDHTRMKPAAWKQRGCKPRVDQRPRLMIGPMLEAGTYRDVLRDTVHAQLAKAGTWNLQLVDSPPTKGFFVDGTVDELAVEKIGNKSYIACNLNLWVRSSGTTVSNLVAGSARVATTQNQRDIALSRQACVTTVAEDLVEKLFAPVVE